MDKKKAQEFMMNMLPEDVVKMGPRKYVLKKVIYPTAAKIVCDFFSNLSKTVDKALLGTVQSKNASSASADTYHDSYLNRRPEKRANSYADVRFESLDRAEKALNTLRKLLDQWDLITVQKYLYVAGYSSTGWNDSRYGWSNLNGVEIERVSGTDEWRLTMPEPSLIRYA